MYLKGERTPLQLGILVNSGAEMVNDVSGKKMKNNFSRGKGWNSMGNAVAKVISVGIIYFKW